MDLKKLREALPEALAKYEKQLELNKRADQLKAERDLWIERLELATAGLDAIHTELTVFGFSSRTRLIVLDLVPPANNDETDQPDPIKLVGATLDKQVNHRQNEDPITYTVDFVLSHYADPSRSVSLGSETNLVKVPGSTSTAFMDSIGLVPYPINQNNEQYEIELDKYENEYFRPRIQQIEDLEKTLSLLRDAVENAQLNPWVVELRARVAAAEAEQQAKEEEVARRAAAAVIATSHSGGTKGRLARRGKGFRRY